ncbi:MAG: hypothetical protein SFY80_04870 [Verrucomicrobiota bacterium]|nr:hypothetical protein [Verrucomicrobiota bacterium]
MRLSVGVPIPIPTVCHLLRISLSALLLLALAGCGSVQEHRIRQYSTIYATYDAPTQERIRLGVVQPGFTERMVYIALGTPKSIEETTPGEAVWTYYGYPISVTLADGTNATAYRTNADLVIGGWDPLKPMQAIFKAGKLVAVKSSQ